MLWMLLTRPVEAAERLKNEPKVKIVVNEPESEAAPLPEVAGEPVLLAEDDEEEDKTAPQAQMTHGIH